MFGYKLILAVAMLATSFACPAAETTPWRQLSAQERGALAPLAQDWDHFPAPQQERLLKVARGYERLPPQQQQLLQARLRAWSRMTPEQRRIARDNYRNIQTLPKQDQIQIKQQWLDSLCQEFGPTSKPPLSPPAP